MAQSALVTIVKRGLAANKKVAIQAACLPEWERLKTIDEPEPGIVHMTIETDTPVEFYLPVGSISGIRFAG